MKTLFTVIGLFCILSTFAQPVALRTVVPVDIDKIDYPNITGNTRSSQAHPGTVVQ